MNGGRNGDRVDRLAPTERAEMEGDADRPMKHSKILESTGRLEGLVLSLETMCSRIGTLDRANISEMPGEKKDVLIAENINLMTFLNMMDGRLNGISERLSKATSSLEALF